MDWGPFFYRTGPIGMDLDNRAVQSNRLQLDAHHLLSLQIFEYPVKHSSLRPSVHPRVDGVPVAKARRQPTPLAALLSNVQDGIEDLQVGQTDVATLNREDGSNAFVLSLCNLHASSVPQQTPLCEQTLVQPRSLSWSRHQHLLGLVAVSRY